MWRMDIFNQNRDGKNLPAQFSSIIIFWQPPNNTPLCTFQIKPVHPLSNTPFIHNTIIPTSVNIISPSLFYPSVPSMFRNWFYPVFPLSHPLDSLTLKKFEPKRKQGYRLSMLLNLNFLWCTNI